MIWLRPSTAWLAPIRIASFVIAGLLATALLSNMLFAPVKGSVLVVLSAKSADRVQAFNVAMHLSSGSWTTLGQVSAQVVPAAPATATVIQTSAAVGDYDSLRVDSTVFPTRIQIRQQILATVLIAISDGGPLEGGVYVGSEGVSLGLNELAGHLKAMPVFGLVDQFGRPFTNATIAGHVVVLAAFHTTCHEACPLVTGLFLRLREQLPDSVLLVEATTSPLEDTPAVLRDYAGQIGAAWTFATGDSASMGAFWKPFDVSLSSGDVHQSTLAIIDVHGYIRSFWLGAPDVGGSLPPDLEAQLSPKGWQLLQTHGNDWGSSQVLDSVAAVGGLAAPSSAGEGPAPEFVLSTLNGTEVHLSDYRGRPALINFWASYCLPCRIEMPSLETMASEHPKLVVLLIDERDDRVAAAQFVSDLKIHSLVLYDGNGRAGDLYRIAGLPTTVFLREDGTIEGRYLGQTNERILTAHISAIGA